MSEHISPPEAIVRAAHVTLADYEELYRRSIEDPDGFWGEEAKRIDWLKAPTRIADWSYDPVEIRWYEDGVLNLCHNCVDRHLADKADSVAII